MTSDPIASRIAHWAHSVTWGDVPDNVRERAALHVLDCVGLAFACVRDDFATVATQATSGEGPAAVIGMPQRLQIADAALLNGILVHGLDYDDTHPAGVIHASASALPTAMAVAERDRLSGADLLLAYLIAVEVSARVGTGARSGFHAKGFHPTGLVGAFGSAVAAARMSGLDVAGITAAQGIVGSLAAGSLQFLDTGAWTKRMHPGWAASTALTSTRFAAAGWEAPPDVYEGRFGLYAAHVPDGHEVDPDAAARGLGEEWELLRVAIKPFPACHFTHAFADATLALVAENNLSPDDIAEVVCLVPEQIVPVVCEPAEAKLTPRSDYDAKFSLPYVVGTAATRGQFTLTELEPEALSDPSSLAVASRVRYEFDPNSTFPKHFCGEVIITTTDGRELRHRESVNRGADERPLSAAEIEEKFMSNVEVVTSRAVGQRVLESVMGLADTKDAADAIDVWRGQDD
jgi:2-methylcitrate dehydratase PrpD